MPRGKYGSRKKSSKNKKHSSKPPPPAPAPLTAEVPADGDADADVHADDDGNYAKDPAGSTVDNDLQVDATHNDGNSEGNDEIKVAAAAAESAAVGSAAAVNLAAVATAADSAVADSVAEESTAAESAAVESAAVESAAALDLTAVATAADTATADSVAEESTAAEASSPYESCDSEPALDSDSEPDEDFELSVERGRGVCVVRAVSTGAVAGAGAGAAAGGGAHFELDEAALAALLARARVPAARPLVLISVAGAFRGGKSFLLDFFLRYLYAEESERADGSWLGAPGEPLRGFSWRGGCAPDTRGLELWSQPFPVTLPDGQKVAVLLLDTQGSFDDGSSMHDCSLVFAVSTLLASVQVYNLSRRIDESDLQHLQMFTEAAAAGAAAGAGAGGALPALQLVVRDWSAPGDYPPGAAGGARYLADKLQVREEQPAEVRDVRARLTRSFERVACCLLPHPGLRAAADPAFRGQLADLTEDFQESLREFVPLLLAPERLRVKTVGGRVLRAGDLAVHLRAYLRTFREHAPSPRSIARAQVTAGWLTAARDARGVLRAYAPARAAPATARAPLRARLAAECRAALAPLPALAARAGDEAGLADLEQELDEQVTQYLDLNENKIALGVAEAKEEWERGVHALHAPALCAPARELRALAATARAAALARYDRWVADPDEPERAQLIEELESRDAELLRAACAASARTAAAATREAVAALRVTLPPPPRHPAELAAAHAAAVACARRHVRAARTLPAPACAGPDPHLTSLNAQIEEILRQHEAQNVEENERAVWGALRAYDGAMALGARCRTAAGLAAAHLRALAAARADFLAARRGARAEDADQFSQQLETSIQERYELYMVRNERNNEACVKEALVVFCKRMDHCSVLRLSAEEMQAALAAAAAAAQQAFRAKRIGPDDFGTDDAYIDQLKQKMREKHMFYHAKNTDKPTGWDIAAPVLGAAATIGLGFLRILR